MRGAQALLGFTLAITGIIPAYAGSTTSRCPAPGRLWDHPRVCGEHGIEGVIFLLDEGSSPRMRGARKADAACAVLRGIIPAYAGSTLPPPSRRPCCRDHPRVCGEHVSATASTDAVPGSSPRMRGARIPHVRRRLREGIIPAYAGSTCWTALPMMIRWDHPRVCGEHRSSPGISFMFSGSSPRMRGARGHMNLTFDKPGIIPAYAGSTNPYHHKS